ncbi:MAG: hypothetical protein A2901_03600 [Elusimicrobia bacterium RIFCSPLOWO2_01_FULL_54_10]|nr:MAG: hypothetical protein A2901_03600 [Elusimicrobia bacterium RIFCSPLOWO2_01_FULL_54_10]
MSSNPPRRDFLEEWSLFLRRVPLFHELEMEDLRDVAARIQLLSLPKGAVVYREGDPSDALYIVQSGRVKATTLDFDGMERILNILGRGETFGETSMLTGTSRNATMRVDSASNFLVLYKKDFEGFLQKNPKAAAYLHRVISRRLIDHPKKSLYPVRNPEVFGMSLELGSVEQMAFLANLALSLKEQTRRRILLIDMGPQGGTLVQALGMEPASTPVSALRADDFSDPKIVDKISVLHPATGLEILVLPADMFSGSLQRVLPAFMLLLHENFDYVLWNVTQAAHRKQILEECDCLFYAHKGENDELARMTAGLPDVTRSFEAVLGSLKASSSTKFFVPWAPPGDGITVPHLTKKVLDRIGRAIGKLEVGFAMGSGASYGYTLIGMLKVFEREKIPIDYVSGTSMGSLLGSFYSSGKSPGEMEDIAHTISKAWLRRNIFRDFNWMFHGGLIKGETISMFLRKHLGETEFNNMPIPFACAATDIMTGDGVVLREGKVWEAVRASLSLPLIFTPYKKGNQFLVDGGLVNPVPTSIIASMGADILISANLTSKASERRVSLRRVGMFPASSPGFFNVFFKMIYTMQYQIASARGDLSNIVIHPETGNFSWIDLHKAKQIIPLGEEAAEEALTKIKARLPYFADYCPVPQRTVRSSSF